MTSTLASRNGTHTTPDFEVPAQARRRKLSAAYKLRVLCEADGCKQGEVGALLRREGLYSSQLATWRKQRQAGTLTALAPRRRGRLPIVLCPHGRTGGRAGRERADDPAARRRRSHHRHPKKSLLAFGVDAAQRRAWIAAMMDAAGALAPQVGVQAACTALSLARSSSYRRLVAPGAAPAAPRPPETALPARSKPRSLRQDERQAVLDVLHGPRFRDVAPAEVYATLLDEGCYLASERTMYRLLVAQGETGERRRQLVHPAYTKPELLADGPNQIWSWDSTKLLGPVTWSYYSLYVLLDISSRYVTGWLLAECEQATLAERLIADSSAKQNIPAGQLTLHADQGTVMTSKPVAWLLADLGITRSHSRPHTSNDNPFSEAQFKTLKYRPDFPARFGSLEDARSFCRNFFPWYNTQHRHAGIGFFTPAAVHTGAAADHYSARQQVLTTAYAAHFERFVRQAPVPPPLPTGAWINPLTITPEQEGAH